MDTLNRLARKTTAHWTQQNIANFVYRISSDFVIQIAKKLEKEKIQHNEFATQLGLTRGRVSQLMNNPGNLTLRNVVHCARTLGMKVAIIAYEDGDPENQSGPIPSEIFSACWQKAGAPRDFFDLASGLGKMQSVTMVASHAIGEFGDFSKTVAPITNDSTSARSRCYLGVAGAATKGIPLEVDTTSARNAYRYAS